MPRNMRTVQRIPVAEPEAFIDTAAQGAPQADDPGTDSLVRLYQWAEHGGDISDLLEPGQLTTLGVDAVRQFNDDAGTRRTWLLNANKFLALAAQERDDDEQRDPIWEGAADINYPILSTAAGQFLARAGPELIKGDKVVGVKVFSPPPQKPDPIEQAKAGPQPQNDQEAQAAMQRIAQATQQNQKIADIAAAKNARAERVKHYLNWLIFYRMEDWEGDSDLLLLQASIIGEGYKKVYMGPAGLRSDFLSSTCLTIHNDTKSLYTCPRVTQAFDLYPYEIETKRRAGLFRAAYLPNVGSDPEQPRQFIEQHRLDDLDGDGLAEPYLVTVDIDTQTVMRVEPAYTTDDIFINEASGKVIRIDRWLPFAPFKFLPDPRGKWAGIGLGKLLDSITDSVDTSINQLIDAGTAEIAGGGFIGSGVRLQGAGQGGAIFQRPGEYLTVNTDGRNLREAIWERTLPHPSAVTMQMLELLLGAAKDIASVKDVITGESPATAPVGTTLALQNQALQVFSSIYKRVYRGFADEFRLMYRCLKRWATERERREYQEITGGDLDEDFSGDGTDIQPVADPTVVTKMQKIAKMQTILQLADSPVGIAAGMTQPGPAQEIIKDALDVLEADRPERYVGPVQPNPVMEADAQDKQASAQLKQAQAQALAPKTIAETRKAEAQVGEIGAKTKKLQAETTGRHVDSMHKLGQTALDTHSMHQIADLIEQTGDLQPPEPEGSENGAAT